MINSSATFQQKFVNDIKAGNNKMQQQQQKYGYNKNYKVKTANRLRLPQ